MQTIESHSKLISALADSMNNSQWADDILLKCSQIEEALINIRRIANARRSGER